MIEKSHLTPPKMNDDPKKGPIFKGKENRLPVPSFFQGE